MTRWIEPDIQVIHQAFQDAVGGHPYVAAALCRRGITDARQALGFLFPQQYTPASPLDLPNMDRVVDRLIRAVKRQEQILVWGDFDVDGQTSTTILVSALRAMGAQVDYYIPVRRYESHGISLRSLQEKLSRHVDVILTCDTGITAFDAVNYAIQHNVDVLITDHHAPAEILPHALAVTSSSLLPSNHPLHPLSGAGVAYKLVEALYAAWGDGNHTDQFLDLVAIGLVTDVVPLIGDARYLVQLGLPRLRETQRFGLRALMELAEIDPYFLNEETIGFGIGPRLNALGKLGDANPMVNFLTTENEADARAFASQLEALNEQRRELRDNVFRSVEKSLGAQPAIMDQNVILLGDPNWTDGILGNVASQLVDKYGKPAALFTIGQDGIARGSARSDGCCDIISAITQASQFLLSFGGHPGAAGLSLKIDNLNGFREALSKAIADQRQGEPIKPEIVIDHFVHFSDLSVNVISDLNRLAPFGPGNPKPVLAARDLRIVSKRRMGDNKEHLRVQVKDEEDHVGEVVWWGWNNAPLPEGSFDLAFRASINYFRGDRTIQAEWLDFRTHTSEAISLPEVTSGPQIIDCRQESNPLPRLEKIIAEGPSAIWGECQKVEGIPLQGRYELTSSETLIVWTTPPGLTEYQAVLEQVKPSRIYLFCVCPDYQSIDAFLSRLIGALKYSVRLHNGEVSLNALAAVTGQSDAAVRAGLSYLQAIGTIVFTISSSELIHAEMRQTGTGLGDAKSLRVRLEKALEETVAFRSLYPLMSLTLFG